MLTHYFTLSALAREWSADLKGFVLSDAYSQAKGELTLAFATAEESLMLKISVRRSFPYVFQSKGYNRARRNTATVFEAMQGGVGGALFVFEHLA